LLLIYAAEPYCLQPGFVAVSNFELAYSMIQARGSHRPVVSES